MMDSTVFSIVDSPEWRAAAGLPRQSSSDREEQQYRSWVRAASKHLRILEVVQSVAEGSGNDESDQANSHQLPFHPLHCAASQGMTTAAKLLLQRCSGSGNGNKQVRSVWFVPWRRGAWFMTVGWWEVSEKNTAVQAFFAQSFLDLCCLKRMLELGDNLFSSTAAGMDGGVDVTQGVGRNLRAIAIRASFGRHRRGHKPKPR